MSAAVWCKEHLPTKTIVHQMYDIVDDAGLNALQLYVQKFKQADLTLTGTVRKATLVNQSTKVPNPAIITPSSNRKASTSTIANGATLSSRGSVSHVKLEHGAPETMVGGSALEKKCVTCNVDVSPKWWPCTAAIRDDRLAASVDFHSAPNGDYDTDGSLHATGLVSHGQSSDNGGGSNMALAAAALHQNVRQPAQQSIFTDFQCHKCHWKKTRKEPTPPNPAPPVQQDPSRTPIPTQPVVNANASDAGVPRSMTQYPWPPPPPSYPPSAPYSNWTRPAPTVAQVTQLNGVRSPHSNNSTIPQINGQPQLRQSFRGIPASPQENGHISQAPNGYSHPPSPHHGLSTAPHMSNGVYTSFATTRPTPQHLTNGGPPPRAPEHPFQQPNAVMHPHQPLGPVQGSPPMPRETYLSRTDPNNPQNNVRSNNGRVNGGASASPSLRNLLS